MKSSIRSSRVTKTTQMLICTMAFTPRKKKHSLTRAPNLSTTSKVRSYNICRTLIKQGADKRARERERFTLIANNVF